MRLFYCQQEIEGNKSCKSMCDHCKDYYKPLIGQKPFAIVLENGSEMDIPDSLIRYLKRHNIDWKWFDMRERFWPENREETFKFFSELPEGQLLVCNTVFDGFQQLELMIEVLYKLKDKKFTIKIQNYSLANNLIEFYEEKRSSITPDEMEAYDEIYKFKIEMNRKFIEVLEAHNIFMIAGIKDAQFKTLEDIKGNLNKY